MVGCCCKVDGTLLGLVLRATYEGKEKSCILGVDFRALCNPRGYVLGTGLDFLTPEDYNNMDPLRTPGSHLAGETPIAYSVGLSAYAIGVVRPFDGGMASTRTAPVRAFPSGRVGQIRALMPGYQVMIS